MKLDAKNPDRLVADRIRLQTQLDLAARIERMWFHKGEVRASSLSPKRDTFFIGGVNGIVNIWRVTEDGPPIASLVHPAAVDAAAYSPDGKRLATGCQDGVRIWEISSGKLLKGPLVARVPHAEMRVASSPSGTLIVFDNSGHYLFAAMREGLNQIWDSHTGEAVGPPIVCQALTASFADSGRLAVLFRFADRTIHAYDVLTGAEKYVLRGEKQALPGRAAYYVKAMVSPDGGTIAACCASGDVVLWKAATGEKVGQMAAPQSPSLSYAAALTPDGQLLATGSFDGTVRNVETG